VLAGALVVGATMAWAASALASGTLQGPKTLVLQKSDFPAGAKVIRTIGPIGASFGRTYRYAGAGGSSELSSTVSVTKSASQASAAYKKLRSDFRSILLNVIKGTGLKPWLTLPRYGDEQFASYHHLDGGKLLVRKGKVLWFLLFNGAGTRTPTKAEAVAELKKYGAKQAKRVGSG
jgi:hypothetical protein